MAEQSTHVTVGVVATLIVDEGQAVEGFKADIRNTGAVSVFVGGAGVTTGNGYEILANSTYNWAPSEPGEALYGIVATGTAVVEVLTEVA